MLRVSKSPSSVDNDGSENEEGDEGDRDNEDEKEDDGNSLIKTVKKGVGLSTIKKTKYVLIFAPEKNLMLVPFILVSVPSF